MDNNEIDEPREPKEHRLFHYTSDLKFLEDMIVNGLWPRYCEEDFEWLVGYRVRLAFPVLCFCDIPIDAGEAHRRQYGDYAICFSKSLRQKFDINPIWYIDANSSVKAHLQEQLSIRPRFSLANLKGHPFRNLLPFLKPVVGHQKDREALREDTIGIFSFDEEMEWRHTPKELSDVWFESSDEGFIKEEHHANSTANRLKLELADIDTVYVPRFSDARALAKKINGLKDKIEVW